MFKVTVTTGRELKHIAVEVFSHSEYQKQLKDIHNCIDNEDMNHKNTFEEIPAAENVLFKNVKRPTLRPVTDNIRKLFSYDFNETNTGLVSTEG